VLFFDNFENLAGQPHEDQAKRGLAQLLKSFSDRAAGEGATLKAVVAGIPQASEDLVQVDSATARRLAQIEVTRMPPGELDQILAHGERKLGISFEGLCRDQILQLSDGFPYYTHLLALHCSRRAMSEARTHVALDDLERALDEILLDCDLELRTAYDAAVETSGDVKLRKSVMEALASLNDLEVPFRAIREAFLERHPEYETLERLNFLSTAITPLRDEYRILADRGLPKSKNNLYRFRNPLMRAYVRLRMQREQRGQQTPADAADLSP
jgi:hypothetical protein